MRCKYGIVAAAFAAAGTCGPVFAQSDNEGPANYEYESRQERGPYVGESTGAPRLHPEVQAEAGDTDELDSEPTQTEQQAMTERAMGGELPVMADTPEEAKALEEAQEMKEDQHAAVDRLQQRD